MSLSKQVSGEVKNRSKSNRIFHRTTYSVKTPINFLSLQISMDFAFLINTHFMSTTERKAPKKLEENNSDNAKNETKTVMQ